MRIGKVFIVVGASGNGKSTLLKKIISKVHNSRLEVYDVNCEYFQNEELEDIDDFVNRMNTLSDMCMVFEEATIFFSNRGSSKPMRKLLVEKRHRRNTVYLVFHSIRSIPHYIYDLTDFAIVFNTNDHAELVENKHPLLFDAYKKVQGQKYTYEIVDVHKKQNS